MELKLTEQQKKQRVFFRGYPLTKKQLQVMNLLVKGYTTDEIIKILHIKRTTLGTHLNSLYTMFRHLNINSISKLIVYYYRGYLKEDYPSGS